MTQALIGYDTWQNEPGLIASFTSADASDPANPLSQALDYHTHTVGVLTASGVDVVIECTLSAPRLCNYIAIAGHNIPEGTDIDIGIDSILVATVTTKGTGPQLLPFDNIALDTVYTFIIRVPASTRVSIGSMFMGAITELPEGLQAPYTPPPLGRNATLYPNVSQRGANFVGSGVQRIDWSFTVEQNNVDPAWIQQNWLAFARHAEFRPFFYLWDTQRPGDAVYAWVDGRLAPPRYSTPLHMAFTVQCRGLHVP